MICQKSQLRISFCYLRNIKISKILKKNDIVIYESTVYPGATEEDCIPVVEQISGLKYNADFYAGYSPERINPGDKEHTVKKILKVTSGSTLEIAEKVVRTELSSDEKQKALANNLASDINMN